MYQIGLYKVDEMFLATIIMNNGRSYDVSGKTTKECLIKIVQFFENNAEWEEG